MVVNAIKNRSVKFIDFTDEIKKSIVSPHVLKKSRIKMEPWQVKRLEEAFEEDTHPSCKSKMNMSISLSLPAKSIQIWFQNRRAKEKLKIVKRSEDENPKERRPLLPKNSADFEDSRELSTVEDERDSSLSMTYDECCSSISKAIETHAKLCENPSVSIDSLFPLLPVAPGTDRRGSLDENLLRKKSPLLLDMFYTSESIQDYMYRNANYDAYFSPDDFSSQLQDGDFLGAESPRQGERSPTFYTTGKRASSC